MESRKSFLLRINPQLWKELEGWAAADMRSVNAQIEYILKQAVQRRKGSGKPPSPQEGSEAAPEGD